MPQSTPFRRPNPAIRIVTLAILAVALMFAVGAASATGAQQAGKPTKRVAKEGQNAALGKTILTTTSGRTLYSLSAEKNGRFICTSSCLSIWHPLVVPTGVKPTGPIKLGTISRPDGKGVQVTYKGRPLYRFGADTKAGDVGGEGIKDVGTWHAAVVPTAQPAPEPQPPAESTPPYPYGY